jgi:membrane associated rhomboid family serine protease
MRRKSVKKGPPMTHPVNETPVNPLPPVVAALALVMAGFELAFTLGSRGLAGGAQAVGWRNTLVERFGFSGRAFDWMLEQGQFPAEHLIRFVTYPFFHAGFTHAAFAVVILLAMGKVVGEVIGSLRLCLLFVACSIAGALAFGLLGSDAWLLGAYPPVYGLIGGFTYLLWVRLGRDGGGGQFRAFQLIGFLMGIQLLFALLFGGGQDWIADLAGFVTGFVLTMALVPGGLARLLAAMRAR